MVQRVTENQLDAKKATIAKLETRIERWERLDKGRECKCGLWKELSPILKTAKESTERSVLVNMRSGKDEDANIARVKAGEAKGYERILEDVDQAPENIKKAREEISLLRQAIKAAGKNRGII